ncbi:unnamed protein product, partial [Rotaria sp. Silwood2]
GLDLVSMSSM